MKFEHVNCSGHLSSAANAARVMRFGSMGHYAAEQAGVRQGRLCISDTDEMRVLGSWVFRANVHGRGESWFFKQRSCMGFGPRAQWRFRIRFFCCDEVGGCGSDAGRIAKGVERRGLVMRSCASARSAATAVHTSVMLLEKNKVLGAVRAYGKALTRRRR